MPNQTKQQEDQAASIIRSAEAMMEKLATEGQFHYLPACNAEDEQTITFDTVMSDCSSNPEFINAVFELYKSYKQPLELFKSGELGEKLISLMDEVHDISMGHVAFCANDEHGVN